MPARYKAGDEPVVDEMFEVDQYGLRRLSDDKLVKVERYMTEKVISIGDTETVQTAREMFKANPTIHHLVVLDQDRHPVGVVDTENVAKP